MKSMMNLIKYAALNLSVPLMLVAELMFGGAFAIGEMNRLVCVVVCLGLVVAIRAAWSEIQQMEYEAQKTKRAAQQARRSRALALQRAETAQEAPRLWVA